MSGIRFSLRAAPDRRIDFSRITPDRLATADFAEILRFDVSGNRSPLHLGELFSVTDGERGQLVIEGGSDRLDFIGLGMTAGEILVEGDVGVQAGRSMTGGRLKVAGSAGHWAGSAMSGGALEILGNAGDFLGGGLAGEKTGMRGGAIFVRGNAGAQAADRLQRGVIVVEGDAGAYAGARMVAGTLVVCGAAGPLPGYLMRRGTIVANAAPGMSPTFVEAPAAALVFTELFARSLAASSERAARVVRAARRRFAGDLATMGKGELFITA